MGEAEIVGVDDGGGAGKEGGKREGRGGEADHS